MFPIDLHLPEDFDDAGSQVITRFFKSLNACEYQMQREKLGQ
ncbi:inovirus Gp2 family protein [Vibrio pacinii]|nr:inovirus Gp2 family protein [Vibrio pacinii]